MSTIADAAVARSGRVSTRLGSVPLLTWIASVVVGIFVLLAIFGPLIAPHSPTAVDVMNVYGGSSSAHWLGTDDTGRDILSRIIHGARPSLLGPAVVLTIAATLGTTLGIVAAWRGGWADSLISRGLDIVFAFPGLLLAIAAVALFGSGLREPALALSIAYTPAIARVVRAAALRERNLPYVEACMVQGMGSWRICLRHVLPNVLPLIVAQVTVTFGYALLELAAVSYLGLGLQPPSPEWGLMTANGQPAIVNGHPEQALYAGLTIVVAVVAFNIVGASVSRRLLGEAR